MEQIWWKHISKAAFLIRKIADHILNGQSLLLSVPESLPWKEEMIELIRDKLSEENNERCLREFDCPAQDAGKYLLEEYCKREKRSQYRAGKSIAAFLAQSDGIVLNSSNLWIHNVLEEQLDDWCSFISEYHKNVPAQSQHAVFVLELREEIRIPKGIGGLTHISFKKLIEPFDVYTFCALSCTDDGFTERERMYLSQTVSAVCERDVELCAYCIENGKAFMQNPEDCLQRILETKMRSNGQPFQFQFDLEQINTKLWESQIKILFPIIEQYRSNFIKRHSASIKEALPIQNAFGEEITSPCDVELGMLVALAGQGYLQLSRTEYGTLDAFRNARNTLAHLKSIPYEKVNQIINIEC